MSEKRERSFSSLILTCIIKFICQYRSCRGSMSNREPVVEGVVVCACPGHSLYYNKTCRLKKMCTLNTVLKWG